MSESDQQNGKPPSHLPAVVPSRPDAVDADFTQPEFIELPRSALADPHSVPTRMTFATSIRMALSAALALGAIYFVYIRRSTVTVPPPKPSAPGWDELAPCAYLSSLDEKKSLTLSDRQGVELTEAIHDENDPRTAAKLLLGTWTYDVESKRYSVSLDGEVINYMLLARGEPLTCMLLKGDLGAADLRGSWFSFPSSDDMVDYDYSPDR